jgi:DNA-binding CsgD family transcriptional regulator
MTDLRHLHDAGIITQRELQVLELRNAHLSQRQVARALDLSRSTIREAEANAHRKIEIHNRKDHRVTHWTQPIGDTPSTANNDSQPSTPTTRNS